MENKQFFDPYNFNNTNPNMNSMNPINSNVIDEHNNIIPQQINPAMFYEQQYWYYNYLTKMLEYKIKLKEYEALNIKKQ
ncbi:MAG: hypothetical protein PHR25_04775 [Clostridia bacterium]|nr:hypothetical protein [Clostridia bacterium]MDD4376078.1 hypothetical protein [Clostridia bacterium]